jgi:flagellar assembly protein FliH
MVALCFEAVCQMAGSAAATPDGLRQLLRQAAARLRTQRGLTVHLHADDLAMLAADPQGAGIDGVQLVADPQVKLGGAILRAQQGSLDARLEAQLALLKDLLMQQRRAHAQAIDSQPEVQA